jgi:hypothetical protein
VIRASGRAAFITIEKNSPAGPPPMQTILNEASFRKLAASIVYA